MRLLCKSFLVNLCLDLSSGTRYIINLALLFYDLVKCHTKTQVFLFSFLFFGCNRVSPCNIPTTQELVCRAAWPKTQEPACLCPHSTGTNGVLCSSSSFKAELLLRLASFLALTASWVFLFPVVKQLVTARSSVHIALILWERPEVVPPIQREQCPSTHFWPALSRSLLPIQLVAMMASSIPVLHSAAFFFLKRFIFYVHWGLVYMSVCVRMLDPLDLEIQL